MKNSKRNSWASFSRVFQKNDKLVGEGHELSLKVRRWAERHPSVRIVTVDDAVFSTSDIVLMPEYVKGELWGIFCVFIPQTTGKPQQFFVYPRNAWDMIDALFGMVAGKPKKEKP